MKRAAPVYRIEVRPEPGVDGIQALRAALKALLRSYGLRAVAVAELDEGEAQAVERAA